MGTSGKLWGELGAAAVVGWTGAGPGWSSRPGRRGLGLLGTRCQARVGPLPREFGEKGAGQQVMSAPLAKPDLSESEGPG